MTGNTRVVKVVGVVIGLAVTCAFGYLAVSGVDFERFRAGLSEITFAWLVPALAALALAVWIRAVRWRLLFVPKTRPPLRAVTLALLIGCFFNQLLPARAGEAARVLALHRDSGTSRAEAAGTAITERVFDVLSLLLTFFVAVPILPAITWIRRAALFAIVFALLLVALIVVVLRYEERPVSFIFGPLTRLPGVSRERVDNAAANLVHGLTGLHRPRLAIPALVATFASWIVLALSFWCGLLAFDLGLGYSAGLLIVIVANLALIAPSGPAGLGVFEAAVVLALIPYGVDRSEALATAVVLHALNLFPFLIAGVWALSHHATLARRRANVGL